MPKHRLAKPHSWPSLTTTARRPEWRISWPGSFGETALGSSGRPIKERLAAEGIVVVDFHLLLPPQGLLRTFEDSVRPFRQQITTLLIQNEKLRAARDLLLPRLMSGDLAV